TIPLDLVYPSFNSSMLPVSSSEDPDARPCVATPARVLPPAPTLFSLLAPYWSHPVESSSQDAPEVSPSAEAPLTGRLPRMLSRLHCLAGWRASACSCASVE